MEEQKIELKIINMADIQSQKIEWLWYPFIPYGKLTIIQGDPGDGKTTLVLNLAAKLSKGIGLDEDMQVSEPMNIIYQTAEDGLADTVKPRLEAADADCEKIMVIDESEKSLSMVDERLEQAIIQTNARLLILDPIQEIRKGYDHAAENSKEYPCDYDAGFSCRGISGVLQSFVWNYEKGKTFSVYQIAYGTLYGYRNRAVWCKADTTS